MTSGTRKAPPISTSSPRLTGTGLPAAMAARAASTNSGWGRSTSASDRARASTDGGRMNHTIRVRPLQHLEAAGWEQCGLAGIVFAGVEKVYGDGTRAVADLDLDVAD